MISAHPATHGDWEPRSCDKLFQTTTYAGWLPSYYALASLWRVDLSTVDYRSVSSRIGLRPISVKPHNLDFFLLDLQHISALCQHSDRSLRLRYYPHLKGTIRNPSVCLATSKVVRSSFHVNQRDFQLNMKGRSASGFLFQECTIYASDQ